MMLRQRQNSFRAGCKFLAEDVAVWKLAKFLDECREEFGHDTKLIANKQQFGLRDDDSPYLKFRQIEEGIALFRKYDRKRAKTIRESLAALKRAKGKRRPLINIRVGKPTPVPGRKSRPALHDNA